MQNHAGQVAFHLRLQSGKCKVCRTAQLGVSSAAGSPSDASFAKMGMHRTNKGSCRYDSAFVPPTLYTWVRAGLMGDPPVLATSQCHSSKLGTLSWCKRTVIHVPLELLQSAPGLLLVGWDHKLTFEHHKYSHATSLVVYRS